MSIGKNIKNLRLNHGLSQKELADIASVSNKTVSAWEQDRVVPRMGAIQKIADYFGILKSDIIEPGKFLNCVADENINPVSYAEKKLLKDFRSLDSTQQQTIVNMLAFFLNQPQNPNDNPTGVVQTNKHGNNIYAKGDNVTYNL